jgi:hypothetical protein
MEVGAGADAAVLAEVYEADMVERRKEEGEGVKVLFVIRTSGG